MSRYLSGPDVEKWFKDFARETGILKEDHFEMEKTIRLFNEQLNQRFTRARKFITNDFVFGDEWIDKVLTSKPLPNITQQVKNEFANRLADLTIGTDTIIQVKNNGGDNKVIAVDVTTNDATVQEKVRKIRGQFEPGAVSNKNANIPNVRTALGVDKHFVALFERTRGKLPSQEKMLDVIYSFAEAESKTRFLDLTNLDPKDRYNWRQEYEADPARMWQKYSQGIQSKASAIVAVEAVKRAYREKHSPEAILRMLTHDPQYRQFVRRDNGDNKAAEFSARAIYQRAVILLAEEEQQQMPQRGQDVSRGMEGPRL